MSGQEVNMIKFENPSYQSVEMNIVSSSYPIRSLEPGLLSSVVYEMAISLFTGKPFVVQYETELPRQKEPHVSTYEIVSNDTETTITNILSEKTYPVTQRDLALTMLKDFSSHKEDIAIPNAKRKRKNLTPEDYGKHVQRFSDKLNHFQDGLDYLEEALEGKAIKHTQEQIDNFIQDYYNKKSM